MSQRIKFIELLFISIFFFAAAKAQQITGRVTDTHGNALQSVSVVLKSNNVGTTTDASGNFTLNAKPGDVLVFTSTGYDPQQITVKDNSFLSVQLTSKVTQLDQIVLLGSRGSGRVKLESPVPVDVIGIGAADQTSARTNLTAMLNYAAPSFNYNKQSGSDGADQIDLATLRGLGPDQTLVLVNGKRRHQTAFVAIFGTKGRGNSGTDLNAIPEASIDRVEILRDGASAQYGSDAIAGVINIILKKQTPWQIDIDGSGYYDKKFNPHFAPDLHNQYDYDGALDGKEISGSINKGFGLGKEKKGFINLTYNFFKQGKTYRQVLDTNLNHKNALPINTGRRTVGDASTTGNLTMMNMELPIAGTHTTFYSFGGYSYRSTDAFAYTRSFYDPTSPGNARPERFITDDNGNLVWNPNIMKSIPSPGGLPNDTIFNPHIQTHIEDGSLAFGFRGTMNDGTHWDISNTFGKNNFHYFGDKTFNASLGPSGINKNHFDDGGFSFLQNTANLDFDKNIAGVASGLNLSAGAEFRYEQYKIYSGEFDSYGNKDPSHEKASGSQGFPGFQPADVVNAKRYVECVYVQGDLNATEQWLVSGAIRAEHYSDFGSLATFKLATRYMVTPKTNIRGSVSTGFRAPSLQQINFSNTFTNFQGGTSFDVRLAPNNNPITRTAGIPKLKQENAFNASLGFTTRPTENLSVTVDGYLVKIRNRVVLSGQFDNSNVALAPILDSLHIAQVQFFANAANTTNLGLDIVVNYIKHWGNSSLNVLLAGNLQHMKIDKINVPAPLNHSFEEQQSFFSQREEKFVLASAPPHKIGLTIDYGINKNFSVGTHFTEFGKIELYGYGWDNTYPPEIVLDNGQTVPEQFNYYGKVTTDVYASYKITKNFMVSLGSDNLFNVHPDLGYVPGAPTKAYDGETGGAWDPVQMGIDGRRLFVKARFTF